jgi:hypothetical protein
MTVAEHLFRIFLGFHRERCCRSDVLFPLILEEEDIMKKFGYIVAALATIAIAAPTIATAETVVIKRGGGHHDGYRERGARAEFRGHGDRGWPRGHDKKVVIIKHGHDHRY